MLGLSTSGTASLNRHKMLTSQRGVVFVVLGAAIYLLIFGLLSRTYSRATQPNDQLIFPRKLWQSWKADALSFEDRDSYRARSWLRKTPTLRYEVLTDDNGLAYVEYVFGPSRYNRPDIVETYRLLNARIIQADLLRYIIMYNEGGIYADVDVEALKPFEHFIPERFQEQDLDMIVGVETDEPSFENHPLLGVKSKSLCQWVFVCKPRQPVMLRLIDNILVWLHDLAHQQNKSISDITLSFDDVLAGTGPTAFTSAILAELSAKTSRKVTWNDFHDLRESKVIGRTLVLPAEAFAAGTGHSASGSHAGKGALVKHHFHASMWTKKHQRYKHPVYGTVEACNWNWDCVRLWDANVAEYDALSSDQQMEMIAMKQEHDSKAETAQEQPQLVVHGNGHDAHVDELVLTEAKAVAGSETESLGSHALKGNKDQTQRSDLEFYFLEDQNDLKI